MNKALFYLLLTLVGLVLISFIWYPVLNKQDSAETSTPASGLVGDTTEAASAKSPEQAPDAAGAMDGAAAPAVDGAAAPAATPETAPAGDVPAGAEVSGEAPASEPAPAPAATDAAAPAATDAAAPAAAEQKPAEGAVAPSEGQ